MLDRLELYLTKDLGRIIGEVGKHILVLMDLKSGYINCDHDFAEVVLSNGLITVKEA